MTTPSYPTATFKYLKKVYEVFGDRTYRTLVETILEKMWECDEPTLRAILKKQLGSQEALDRFLTALAPLQLINWDEGFFGTTEEAEAILACLLQLKPELSATLADGFALEIVVGLTAHHLPDMYRELLAKHFAPVAPISSFKGIRNAFSLTNINPVDEVRPLQAVGLLRTVRIEQNMPLAIYFMDAIPPGMTALAYPFETVIDRTSSAVVVSAIAQCADYYAWLQWPAQ